MAIHYLLLSVKALFRPHSPAGGLPGSPIMTVDSYWLICTPKQALLTLRLYHSVVARYLRTSDSFGHAVNNNNDDDDDEIKWFCFGGLLYP